MMFYHIKGALALKEPNIAVIDCGGVGYQLTVSTNTSSSLPQIGAEVKLFTHFAVREDAVELYGFGSIDEKNVFKMLISVSGVGPKAAMSILSTLPPEKLAVSVTCEDVKAISRAPGVGAKTAARIVLELKDKLAKEFGGEGIRQSDGGAVKMKGHFSEATDALLVLGYSRSEALSALRDIDPAEELEVIIKQALAKLMK